MDYSTIVANVVNLNHEAKQMFDILWGGGKMLPY